MGRMVRKDGRPMANLSRHHPDFGMMPQQHEGNKAGRAAGTVAFKPKSSRA